MKRELLMAFALTLILGAFRPANAQGRIFSYESEITLKEATLSGICTLKESSEKICGTMLNEFGITLFSFEYNRANKKVKLLNINNLLDKWYLRKTLRRDLKALLPELSNWENPIFGDVEYTNQSRGIVYSFKLLNKENETGE